MDLGRPALLDRQDPYQNRLVGLLGGRQGPRGRLALGKTAGCRAAVRLLRCQDRRSARKTPGQRLSPRRRRDGLHSCAFPLGLRWVINPRPAPKLGSQTVVALPPNCEAAVNGAAVRNLPATRPTRYDQAKFSLRGGTAGPRPLLRILKGVPPQRVLPSKTLVVQEVPSKKACQDRLFGRSGRLRGRLAVALHAGLLSP